MRMELVFKHVPLVRFVTPRRTLVFRIAMNVCTVRMGFVSERVPTPKSAAAVNASTQVNITVA